MKNDKRGQAALEFLTTYGWAFLVILIMIAALAYFGVLTPSNFLPERCNVPAEFSCSDFQVVEDGSGNLDLSLQMTNNVGSTITVQDIDISGTAGVSTAGYACPGFTSTQLSAGQSSVLTCSTIPPQGSFPSAGEKQKLEFVITYQEAGGQFNHTITGEVFATIQ